MSSRSYVAGLPVVITVSDDGTVEYEIDVSEASSEMSENWGEGDNEDEGTENEMLLDCAVVDAVHHVTSPDFSVTIQGSQIESVKCPVRYACGFTTRDLNLMAAHIDGPEETHGE